MKTQENECVLENFHATNCTWCHIRGLKNINHPQRVIRGLFVNTTYKKCVHYNLIGTKMKEMKCGHVCCQDNCVTSHKALQDNKDLGYTWENLLIIDDCQNGKCTQE